MPAMSDDDLLADLLLRWDELREQGQDVSPEELCRDCPQLAEELARRIKVLKITSWLDEPVDVPPLSPEASNPGDEPRFLAGRYRLDASIAEGGFAQVWRAYDLELQRVVAIKLPRPNSLTSAETFIAEARRVASLKHPGIVPVFDTGRVQGNETCFFVTEYVEGGSLAERIRRGPVPQADAVRYVADIAEALAYAHRQGFIHRDVKPGNILLDHHGRALLADFGIAVAANEAAGAAFGTLRYMSPEQVQGKPLDARSDLYSLGVVLHELLAGSVPYSSTDLNALRREIVAGATTASGIPEGLRPICRKLLEQEPAARHASAEDLAAGLRRFLAAGDRSSSRWKTVGIPLALLVIIASPVWVMAYRSKHAGQPRSTASSGQPSTAALPATVGDALALGQREFERNYFENAEAAYSEAIRLDPDCAEAYRRRGASKFNQGRVKDSLPDFTKALELDPQDAEACNMRGLAYANLRDFTPAIADLERALTLDLAQPAPCHDLLARVYSNRAADEARNKQFAAAAADVTEAMKHDPQSAIFYHQRGSCYYNLGEFEKAAADFSEAIEREPAKASHYRNRGHSRQALGQDDEANTDFEKAKSLEDSP